MSESKGIQDQRRRFAQRCAEMAETDDELVRKIIGLSLVERMQQMSDEEIYAVHRYVYRHQGLKGLGQRGVNFCARYGCVNREMVSELLRVGKFSWKPLAGYRAQRNFGWKLFSELYRWAGLQIPQELQYRKPVFCLTAVKKLSQMERLIQGLANCEWRGKDAEVQRLILAARKCQGWSKSEIEK